MRAFIGSKIILGESMDKETFHETIKPKGNFPAHEDNEPGYHVVYPDNYHSWSPKAVFEEAYREISKGELNLIENPVLAGLNQNVKK